MLDNKINERTWKGKWCYNITSEKWLRHLILIKFYLIWKCFTDVNKMNPKTDNLIANKYRGLIIRILQICYIKQTSSEAFC